MKQRIFFLILVCCFNVSFSQTHLEIFTGYQRDINNSRHHFNMLNSGVQISWTKSRTYELLLQVQKSWPLASTGNEIFYTSNPALPLQMNGSKTYFPSTATISLGHRFVVTNKKFDGAISILLYTGLAYQKIKVTYRYDKENYVPLNPDQSQDRTGYFISAGAEYMKQLKNGRLFFQLLASPQPVFKKLPKNISYNMMAPLSFNAGYSVILKTNKKHVK